MRNMRPDVEVYEIDPEDLNMEVARLWPDFVVCSQVTSSVESRVPVWVELYPGYEARSRVSFWGESTTIADVKLTDLLDLLDRAQNFPALG